MDLSVENVLENLQYEDSEQRDIVKQYFTNPQEVDRKKKTIIFSTPSETGTSFFRIFEPMRVMWKHFRDEANFIYTENLQPNHLKLADMIVMHRAGNLHSHFLSVAKMWPKTESKPLIVHDVDDNEFNLPRTHPMRDIWYTSGKDKMSIQALKDSDFVITTTEKLRKTFSRMNNDVHIMRNMFDWDLPQWNFDKEEVRKEMIPEWGNDKIVIGWAGLTSHFEDIKRMHKAIKAIHDKHPNTVFVLAGMALKDSSIEIDYDEDGTPIFKEKEIEDESMLYRNRVKKLYEDIDPSRIKVFDALPLEKYGKFNALFDISLAYIEHNTFNSCKSEIKVIEAIHYNAIPVFSNFGGYADFWRSVPKDLKTKFNAVNSMTPVKWIEALDHWVTKLNELIPQNEKGVIGATEKIMTGLKEYSDAEYDMNNHVEERLFFLLNKIEQHEEDEVNRIAVKYK
jgi:glycosyltransferase involved in cell wall biosynthesis